MGQLQSTLWRHTRSVICVDIDTVRSNASEPCSNPCSDACFHGPSLPQAGESVAFGSEDGTLQVMRLANEEQPFLSRQGSPVSAVALSPRFTEGHRVVAAPRGRDTLQLQLLHVVHQNRAIRWLQRRAEEDRILDADNVTTAIRGIAWTAGRLAWITERDVHVHDEELNSKIGVVGRPEGAPSSEDVPPRLAWDTHEVRSEN